MEIKKYLARIAITFLYCVCMPVVLFSAGAIVAAMGNLVRFNFQEVNYIVATFSAIVLAALYFLNKHLYRKTKNTLNYYQSFGAALGLLLSAGIIVYLTQVVMPAMEKYSIVYSQE